MAPDNTQDMLNVVVAKATLEFHAPARFDEDLTSTPVPQAWPDSIEQIEGLSDTE